MEEKSDDRFTPRLALAQNGMSVTGTTLRYHTAICADLLPSDDMGIRDLLRLPQKYRRARSKVKSDGNSVDGRRVDLVTMHHSEPNLGSDPQSSQHLSPQFHKIGNWMVRERPHSG